MFKRFKILIGFIAAIFISASSIGLAYWYFGDQTYTPDVNQEIMVDNIKENYTFGRNEEESKTYTLYLFPSTAYAEIYDNYLNHGSNLKPEEAFGYFTVSFDAEGNKVINVNRDKVDTTNNKYENYVSLISKDDEYKNAYLSYDYDEVYRASNTINSNNKTYELNGLGEPNLENSSDFAGNNDFSNKEGNGNRFDSENKYRYDRFGAWGDLHSYKSSESNNLVTFGTKGTDGTVHYGYDLGRYLPQKLEVSQSITVDNFLKYTMEPITSMGDAHYPWGWYNLKFCSWVTFNGNESPYTYYDNWLSLSTGAQCAGDIDEYFDIMRNLDEYADENNVIRLFPYFSNGKGYKQYAGSNDIWGNPQYVAESARYEYGMRDAFKFSTNNTRKYLMYNSEVLYNSNSEYFESNTIDNAAYAVLPNISITSNTTSITIQCGYLDNDANVASWSGDWSTVLNLDVNAITNNLVNEYGYGLYNFYVFIGNCENSSEDYRNDLKGIGSDADLIFNHATTSTINWPKLFNKKIIRLNTVRYAYSTKVFSWLVYYHRPLTIAFEKVSEGRLYKDIPVKSNSGGSSTTDNNETIEYEYSGTTSDFDSFINSSYDNANAFIMTNQSIYNYKSENGNYTLDTTKDYSANNPYIYVAKNVDLTNKDNDVFQILFNKVYNGEIIFDINCTGMPQDIVYNPELVTDESGKSSYMYNTYNIYHSAKSYFSSANLLIGDQSRSAFKINIHGMYDFILIYDEEPNSNTIHVYCRRHESNFIKLFPSKDVINVDEDGFAIHKNSDDTELSTLEWKLECAIGDTLTASSLGLDLNNNEINFENALKGCVQEISGSKNPIYSNYIVRDYVTSRIVAYFDSSNVLHCNFQIEKNYLLYVEHLSSTSTGNVQNN